MYSVKGFFNSAGLFAKIIFFVLIILISGVISIALVNVFTDGNLQNMSTLRVSQIIESFGVFVFPPIFFSFFISQHPVQYLGINHQPKIRLIFLISIITVALIPFINFLTYYNHQVIFPEAISGFEKWVRSTETNAAEITEKMVNVTGSSMLIFNLFLMALLPAIGEELFFRATIQKLLSEKINAATAVWITAILFSAFHMQFLGFVPRMILGAFLGYVYFWTGNLWYPVTIHFINNALAVVFYYFKFNGYVHLDIDKIGGETNKWLGVVSALVSTVLIIILYIQTRKNKSEV